MQHSGNASISTPLLDAISQNLSIFSKFAFLFPGTLSNWTTPALIFFHILVPLIIRSLFALLEIILD